MRLELLLQTSEADIVLSVGLPHSKTLGVDRIYVIGLRSRKDRQERMRKLERAMGAFHSTIEINERIHLP